MMNNYPFVTALMLAPMVAGLSTTKLIERIVKAYGGGALIQN